MYRPRGLTSVAVVAAGLLSMTSTMVLLPCCYGGRPLTVDDAFPVSPGTLEFDGGVGYVKDSSTHDFDFPMELTYGLVSNLDLSVSSGGVIEEREETVGRHQAVGGPADLVVGSKWNLLTQKQAGAAFALSGSVKFPTADHDRDLGSGKEDFDLTLIASRYWDQLGNLGTHVNVGYTWIGDDVDVLHYGLAGEYPLTDKLSVVAEVFANTPVKNSGATSVSVNGGGRFTCFDGLTLDAAVGAGLRDDAPDLTATFGVTWDFDLTTKNNR